MFSFYKFSARDDLKPKGFTLVELIVAISVFAGVITIVSGIYVSSFRVDRKTAFQQQVLEDARFLLKKIANEIRGNTLDYEEYYNQLVLGAVSPQAYGANYGVYRGLFYHPGFLADGVSLGEIGSLCSDGTPFTAGRRCTILRVSEDRDTGQNPYAGSGCAVSSASAVHDMCAHAVALLDSPNLQDELYLISGDASVKKIFAREVTGREDPADDSTETGVVSLAEMAGIDTDNDGVVDSFECLEGYVCGASVAGLDGVARSAPDRDDLLYENIIADPNHNFDFVLQSPSRLDVQSIRFYISPLENPLLAFAEESPSVQHVPYVTIFLTVRPNIAEAGEGTEEFSITLQETVTTNILSPVPAQARQSP